MRKRILLFLSAAASVCCHVPDAYAETPEVPEHGMTWSAPTSEPKIGYAGDRSFFQKEGVS